MADPRAEMAALRDIGVGPPPRPAAAAPASSEATPPAPPKTSPATAAKARRPAKKSSSVPSPRGRAVEPVQAPVGPPSVEDRRSRHTTVYLEAPARVRLEERLEADPDATVADVMLGAVRAGIAELRQGRPPTPAITADDPIPPPPRRRRRRRVEDGRAVPVRFSTAEREALDRLGQELDMSVSGLISAALAVPSPQSARRTPATAKRKAGSS
ncbi:MAG: hypothetical protein ABR540_11080 [Acidimicrobiales bacterium]